MAATSNSDPHCIDFPTIESSNGSGVGTERRPGSIEILDEESVVKKSELSLPGSRDLNGAETVIVLPEPKPPQPSFVPRRVSDGVALIVAGVAFMLAFACYVGLRIAIVYGELDSASPTGAVAFLGLIVVCASCLAIYSWQVCRRFIAIREIASLQTQLARSLPDRVVVNHNATPDWDEDKTRQRLGQHLATMSCRADEKLKETIEECRMSLAESHNDLKTAITAIEAQVLSDFDEQADEAIRTAARRVGFGTALATKQFDGLIILWNALWLVDRMTIIYSGRPGNLGTLLLLFRAARQVLAGELANQAIAGLGGLALNRSLGLLGGRAAEGAVNALLMLRMGEALRRACRPIPPKPVPLGSLISKAIGIVFPMGGKQKLDTTAELP